MPTDYKSGDSQVPPRLTWWQRLAAAGLLGVYYVACVSAVVDKSATFDEPHHQTTGYTYWKLHDYRLQPQNGNLPQRWAAIPLLFGEYNFPNLEQEAWWNSLGAGEGDDVISSQFFYTSGNDADRMLLLGRAMIALFGVCLGALLFAWSRRLLGNASAFLTLGLFAFCPTMLANGPLVTSDMTAALFFTATVAALWAVLNRANWKTLLVSSLVTSGLLLAKFSAAMIVVMAATLWAVQLASNHPLVASWRSRSWAIESRSRRFATQLGIAAVHAVVAWAVIWAFHDFRYELLHATTTTVNATTGETEVRDHPLVPWNQLLEQGGLVRRSIALARDWHLLPEGYLYGFAHAYNFAQQRRAFFNGAYGDRGWTEFFPFCLATKTPLTLFVLMALGAVAVRRSWQGNPDDTEALRKLRRTQGLYRTAPLWTLFVVYWAFALTSHLNIGHRHILPTYPPMLMLAGAAALWLSPVRSASPAKGATQSPSTMTANRMQSWLVLGCTALFCLESAWIWPNYLAYFNLLAGGPAQGYRRLVDASLDWGQDLPALKKWLEHEGLDNSPGRRVYLAYFGVANPAYYQIPATMLPSIGITDKLDDFQLPWEPGTYCFSATVLQNVYGAFPGRWCQKYEEIYRALRQNLSILDSAADDPARLKQLVAESGGENQVAAWRLGYQQLRLARLCKFLLKREPDAQINHSILVYRVSQADLKKALDGPPPEFFESPI